MRIQLDSVSIETLPGWADVTDSEVDGATECWTLARDSEDACGAFQLTFALYSEGTISEPTPEELAEMLHEFAEANELDGAADEQRELEPLRLASATFQDEQYTVRVWFVSDGASFAQATYTAQSDSPYAPELENCEQMIRTLAFPKPAAT